MLKSELNSDNSNIIITRKSIEDNACETKFIEYLIIYNINLYIYVFKFSFIYNKKIIEYKYKSNILIS